MILGSRIALGVYVPALSLKKQLEALGDRADLLCLEDLYRGKDSVMEETKRSFHGDFRLARISYRIPARSKAAVDSEAVRVFLNEAAEKKYDAVITFSGFFVETLNKLATECPHYQDRIYAVHMDSVSSRSWKDADLSGIQEIWLYREAEQKIICSLEQPANTYSGKCSRILVHGGGWGIGEYRNKIRRLNERGIPLDIIVYYPEEAAEIDPMNDCYLLDSSWKPGSNTDEYPRLLKYHENKWCEFADRRTVNPLRILMERDIAALSKPGGGTLADSLCTGTPLLFSEELASYEKENRILWEQCGFGIGFEDFLQLQDWGNDLLNMRKRLKETAQNLPLLADCFHPAGEGGLIHA